MKANEVIKLRRKELGLTMKDVANAVGVAFFPKRIKKHPVKRQIQRSTGCYHCRQRGSNPHSMLIDIDVGRCCVKMRSNSKMVKYYHI